MNAQKIHEILTELTTGPAKEVWDMLVASMIRRATVGAWIGGSIIVLGLCAAALCLAAFFNDREDPAFALGIVAGLLLIPGIIIFAISLANLLAPELAVIGAF